MKLLGILIPAVICAQPYTLGPDSQRRPDVPQGKVTKYTWATSKIYPGTTRDYWVYVPAQYDAAKPACVTIFQDGGGFISDTGAWRAPIVFDNLIYKRVLRRQGHLPWQPVKLPRPQLQDSRDLSSTTI